MKKQLRISHRVLAFYGTCTDIVCRICNKWEFLWLTVGRSGGNSGNNMYDNWSGRMMVTTDVTVKAGRRGSLHNPCGAGSSLATTPLDSGDSLPCLTSSRPPILPCSSLSLRTGGPFFSEIFRSVAWAARGFGGRAARFLDCMATATALVTEGWGRTVDGRLR